MAETTKKFLDFTGLQKYDELLKAKVAADIQKVQDDLNTRLIKDTANSDTITWSKAENGTYTASVKGVVLDNADYTKVKINAENSAAAWTKFLTGSSVIYPNGITPVLKDLATKTETTDALDSAKSYADGLVKDAEGNVKFDTKGSAAQALADAKAYANGLASNYDAAGSAAQALVDAKAYADGLNTTMSSRVDALEAIDHNAYKAADETTLASAKSYADGLAKNYDAAGAAASALADAKKYADDNFDTKGSAESAKTEAISKAKEYTDAEIVKVNEAISSINTSIAGGVHFIGISTTAITDKGTETPTISGWTGPVKTGDIVINNAGAEFIWDGSKWQKLGDTTAELERISNLEGHVNTLIGDENTTGSVNNAIKVAKTYADVKIDDLVNKGQVKSNTDAIAVLNGAETVEGSVAKALKDAKDYAKDYADGVGSAAQSHADTKIAELVSETGQVGINTAAITKLNADSSTVGSVDYKIAQAVSNIEASIETIPESDINSLFGK